MNWLRSIAKRKSFYVVAIAAFFLLLPNVSHAFSVFGIGDVAFAIVSKLAFAFGWTASLILGIFIAILGYGLQLILLINMNIVNSPLVEAGFPVVLSLTNLLFVFGLIVMAVATILQIESYGMKQTLWKIMVMAIAVNFGLVVAGTILKASDSVTFFMIDAITPGSSTGDSNYFAFANVLTQAFNPQQGLLTITTSQIQNPKEMTDLASLFSAVSQTAGSSMGAVAGTFMSVLSALIMIVVLGSLLVILLIRYVKLTFALVMLPIAWATWPFPAYKKHFSKWWHDFTQQALYPIPLVFCLWLGLTFMQAMGNPEALVSGGSFLGLTIPTESDGPGAAMAKILGGLFLPSALKFLQLMMIAGVMFAGFAAAKAMGAEGAHAGSKASEAFKNRMKKEFTDRAHNRTARAKMAVQEKVVNPARIKTLELKKSVQQKVEGARDRMAAGISNPTLKKFVGSGLHDRYKIDTDPYNDSKVQLHPHIDESSIVDLTGQGIRSKTANIFDNDGNVHGINWDFDRGQWTKNRDGRFVTMEGVSIEGKVRGAKVDKDGNEVKDAAGNSEYVWANKKDAVGKDGKPKAKYLDHDGKLMHASHYKGSQWTAEFIKKIKDENEELEHHRDEMVVEAKQKGGIISAAFTAPFQAAGDAISASVGLGGSGGHGEKKAH